MTLKKALANLIKMHLKDKEKLPPKKVRLTLKGIEIPHYPAIDDALAKKMGTKNEKELRERLEKLLNTQADEAVQKEHREQMSTYHIENYQFELPKTLLQRETQFRIKQLVQDNQFQQKLTKMSEDERKEAIKDIEAQGEKPFAFSISLEKSSKTMITTLVQMKCIKVFLLLLRQCSVINQISILQRNNQKSKKLLQRLD